MFDKRPGLFANKQWSAVYLRPEFNVGKVGPEVPPVVAGLQCLSGFWGSFKGGSVRMHG